MKNITVLVLLIFIIIGCSTTKPISNKVGTPEVDIDTNPNNLVTELNDVFDPNKSYRVAVTEFEYIGNGISENNTQISERIENLLFNKFHNVQFYEYSNLEKIFKIHNLQLSGITDESTAVEIGKLVSANTIITGNYYTESEIVNVNLSIIDVETGKKIYKTQYIFDDNVVGNTSNNSKGESAFNFKNGLLKSDTQLVDYDKYILIYEDEKEDFFFEHELQDDIKYLADIKNIYYYEDSNYYYFLVDYYHSEDLKEVSMNMYFFGYNYDTKTDYNVYINRERTNTITIGYNINEDQFVELNVNRDYKFYHKTVSEIRIPKVEIYWQPNEIHFQSRINNISYDRAIINN